MRSVIHYVDNPAGERGKCPDGGAIVVIPASVLAKTVPLFVIEQDNNRSPQFRSSPRNLALLDGGSAIAFGTLFVVVSLPTGGAIGGGPRIKAGGYRRVVFYLAAAAGLTLPPVISASGPRLNRLPRDYFPASITVVIANE